MNKQEKHKINIKNFSVILDIEFLKLSKLNEIMEFGPSSKRISELHMFEYDKYNLRGIFNAAYHELLMSIANFELEIKKKYCK